ncbi:hypothetical protein WME91_33520 [Sorangium sp. So ce269]
MLAGRYDGDASGETTGLDFGGCSLPGPYDRYAMFAAKLDPDGNHVWSNGFSPASATPSHFTVYQIATDAVNNAHIAFVDSESAQVMKLDAAGNALWRKGMIGYPSDPISLALDSAGNVLTVHSGYYPDESRNGLFISKLSPSGDLLWRYQSPGDTWNWFARSVAVTSANEIFATVFEGTVDFGAGPLTSTPSRRDGFLLKLDPSGAPRWSQRFEDRPYAMTVDESGDVWLAGVYGSGLPAMGFGQCLPPFDYGIPSDAAFVVKLDRDGDPLWRQGPILSPVTSGLDSFAPEQIAVDGLGNAYLAYVNSEDWPNAFLAKLSPAGNVLWNQQITSSDSWMVHKADIAIDSAGNVLAVTAPESAVAQLTVTKLAPTGAVIWSQAFAPEPSIPPGGDPGDAAWSVAVNATDEVLVAGITDGTVDLGGGVLPAGPVLLKLDAAGAYVFSDSVPFGDSLALDPTGNIVVAGSGLAKLDPSGAELWTLSFAAGAKDMTVAPTGTIALTGAASSAVDFGTGPIPYAAGSDAFVATFAP